MKFRLITEDLAHIELTEANLNRVVNGHDASGYAILSAERCSLWKNILSGEVSDIEPKKDKDIWKKLKVGSTELTDANNIRTKNLRNTLYTRNISFIPVFGGFKEEGQLKANIEKSFIVFPFNWKTKRNKEFDQFANEVMEIASDYNQDAILIKYPDKNPRYYDPKTKGYADDYEFIGTSLNDVTKEYFTALKKWDDISNKDDFSTGKPQRYTFEAYMNDFPKTINEHRIRSGSGEMVRFEN